MLQDLGCPHGQGYLLASPMPAPALAAWLTGGASAGATSLAARTSVASPVPVLEKVA
jgi:hypothetical protein